VAGGAIREVILLNITRCESLLPDVRVFRRRPIHLINLAQVTKLALGISMAGEAPSHGHVGGLPGDRHFIDPSMARRTADPLVNVDGMVEIHIAWHFIHRIPLDGFVLGMALTHGGEDGRVFPDLRMAGHARLRVRHPRIGRRGYGGMTKAAVDAEFARVVLVTKGNRLVQRHADIGPVGRAVKEVKRISASNQKQHDTRREKLRVEVDCGWEELGHNSVPPATV
jgi:hypothetical protein